MKPTLRTNARRLPVATAAALALVLGVAACSGSATSPASAPVPTRTVTGPPTAAPTPHTPRPTQPRSTPTPARYSLTVVNSFIHRPGDYLWIEGAVAEIALRSGDGTRLTKIARFGADVVFDDLEPGRYAVHPAARPCSGTCDHLDGRTGECATVVDIPATTRLIVEHTVGRTCAVRTS